MSLSNDNQQNALIDALKYTSDVVSELTIKINNQDDDINILKHKNNLMEENIKKIFIKLTKLNLNTKKFSNIELNTDDEEEDTINESTNKKSYVDNIQDSNDLNNSDNLNSKSINSHNSHNSHESYSNTRSRNFEITSIADTEINKLKKIKVNQLVDKLIQKKKEINNIIETNNENKNNSDMIKEEEEEEKKTDTILITRRRNKIMRRF